MPTYASPYATYQSAPNSGGGIFFNGQQIASSVPQISQGYSGGNFYTNVQTPQQGLIQSTQTPVSPSSSGGSAPVSNPNGPQYGWGQTFPNMDAYNAFVNNTRNDINSGYNDYFNQLDQISGGLNGQRSALETSANATYDSNLADLTGQKTQGLQDIQNYKDQAVTQQDRSLRDLADQMQNQLQAGNVYLGARGAGDSSAANQYSYALTKLGNKQRGTVVNQTNDNLNQLNQKELQVKNIFNTESNKLKASLQDQIAQVANWFYGQQNAIQQAKAQGVLAKGQDLANLSKSLLGNAMQAIATLQANHQSQQNALLSWATSTAQNIGQLKQNLQAVSQFNMPSDVNTSLAYATPQVNTNGGITAPFGLGYTNDQQKQLPTTSTFF